MTLKFQSLAKTLVTPRRLIRLILNEKRSRESFLRVLQKIVDFSNSNLQKNADELLANKIHDNHALEVIEYQLVNLPCHIRFSSWHLLGNNQLFTSWKLSGFKKGVTLSLILFYSSFSRLEPYLVLLQLSLWAFNLSVLHEITYKK